MKQLLFLLVTFLALTVAPPATALSAPKVAAAYFLVDVHKQQFVVAITDAATIAQANQSITGHTGLFPSGKLAPGDGGFNRPYHWHLVPDSVRLVQVSIELCDGLPDAVEANLGYWINEVGRYCPWSGRVVRQIIGTRDVSRAAWLQ